MGSIASGIFGLLGGDPAKAQEDQLSGLGSYETGVGEGLTTAGAGFEESILSGDPTKMATALAPEISTGQQQVSQAAKTGAEFGSRSGGTAASAASAQGAERGNIINLEGELQSGAARTALSAGGGLLGQASTNINDVAELKTAEQAREQADVGGIVSGAAGIAGDIFSGGAAGEMGGGGSEFGPSTDLINSFVGSGGMGDEPNE